MLFLTYQSTPNIRVPVRVRLAVAHDNAVWKSFACGCRVKSWLALTAFQVAEEVIQLSFLQVESLHCDLVYFLID
jgi:hypothetical protein